MIYVISLKKTPERLDSFKKLNRHINFEVFDAVDGSELDCIGNYGHGGMGNAMSHIALWKLCAAGDETFTICEDDAILHKNFNDVLYQLKIMNPYDFICWGWNFDAHLWASPLPFLTPIQMVFNQDSMRANKQEYLENHINYTFLRLHLFNGTFCYSITPAGARQFLDICYPLKPMVEVAVPNAGTWQIAPAGLDSAMPEAYQKTKSVVCFPPLALCDNDHSISTVQND